MQCDFTDVVTVRASPNNRESSKIIKTPVKSPSRMVIPMISSYQRQGQTERKAKPLPDLLARKLSPKHMKLSRNVSPLGANCNLILKHLQARRGNDSNMPYISNNQFSANQRYQSVPKSYLRKAAPLKMRQN